MTTATDPNKWPKTYLLKLYQDAVTHGCICLSPITAEKAKSLTQAFYRLRRRADKSVLSFIQPEFQLVSVSRWSPDYGGCLYFIYSSLPEGETLPTSRPVSPTEAEPLFTPTEDSDLPPDLVLDTSDINVSDFVQSLRKPRTSDNG